MTILICNDFLTFTCLWVHVKLCVGIILLILCRPYCLFSFQTVLKTLYYPRSLNLREYGMHLRIHRISARFIWRVPFSLADSVTRIFFCV
uniref:Uncharacterized protein n=1 Tax=Pararge aegeria TaxID=116150 RepID=S4P6D8_9NEOP